MTSYTVTRSGRHVRPPQRLIESDEVNRLKQEVFHQRAALEREVEKLHGELSREVASLREEILNTRQPPLSSTMVPGNSPMVTMDACEYSPVVQGARSHTSNAQTIPKSYRLVGNSATPNSWNTPESIREFAPNMPAQQHTVPYHIGHGKTLLQDNPHMNAKPSVPVPQTTAYNTDSTPQNNAEASLLHRLADLLSAKQDHLPRMEPEDFSGDLLKFPEWIRSFDVLIEGHTSSPVDRLHYLGKYTAGDAKASIRWYLTLDSANAYDQAKATLVRRYGDKYKISEAFRKKMDNWPAIKPGDGDGLQKFSDFLYHCRTAMDSISYLRSLDSPEENKKLVQKLPRYVTHKWSRIVDRWLHGNQSHEQTLSFNEVYEGCYPPFDEFCKFVADEARVACCSGDFYASDKEAEGKATKPRYTKRAAASSFASQADNTAPLNERKLQERKPLSCFLCKDPHTVDKCHKFKKMSPDERKAWAKRSGLCYGCFRRNHLYKDCRKRNPQLMFGDQTSSAEASNQLKLDTKPDNKEDHVIALKTDISNDSCPKGHLHSMIMPVMLYHKDDPGKQIETYALLDNQSNACFIAHNLLQELSPKVESVNLKLTTLSSEKVMSSNIVHGLAVQGINESDEISLPSTYSRSSIPVDRSLIPRPETVEQWSHLKTVSQKLQPYRDDIEIGLLIGFNCSVALLPREVITAGDNDPYAERTTLGWGVTGDVNPHKCNSDCDIDHVIQGANHFSFRTQVKEVTMAQVKQMLDLDFCEHPQEDKVSVQDRLFLKQTKEGIHKREDGHFEMPLPFKNKNIKLPNNKSMAENRLRGLRRKLSSDAKYKSDYVAFMAEMINKGYAEQAPIENDEASSGRQWYIPHHGVYHPQKPGKIRIVFDCSAEYEGHSLNQNLLPGPDLINNLSGVLCRFRRERIALTCDIEAMFHQVGVDPADRDFLRFLWWEEGNLDTEPLVYRMTAHLFGATSSPGCVNVTLKTVADTYELECGSKAADFVRNNFYVDDGLVSVPTIEEAHHLIESTVKLCSKGGFRLHKFSSNSREVLQQVPKEDRENSIKNVDFDIQTLPLLSAVGIRWCLESDTLSFRIELQDKPFTRRGLLSTVSSIYDPLGLVSPFILSGRKLLQELCKSGGGWDDPLPDNIARRWELWRSQLLQISKLQIPRCYKNEVVGDLSKVELHHFSDASQDGYGQCSYVRLIDTEENVCCSLVMAKARVAPIKSVTIPRLELTAAVTSVRVSNFLDKELKYDEVEHVFWTDSKVVLGYIANESRRFHIFVANRVQSIRDSTSTEQWNHVDTKLNPADITSRGMGAEELMNSTLWWKGPSFLSSTAPLPLSKVDASLTCGDPEVKKVIVHVSEVQTAQPYDLLTRLQYFSTWHRAVRAVAVCLRLKKRLMARAVKKPQPLEKPHTLRRKLRLSYVPVDVHEMQEAERVIITETQKQAFPEEYKTLSQIKLCREERSRVKQQKLSIKHGSCMFRLDPYIGDDALIRVGGRIRRANVPRELAHPVLLPKNHHISKLIIGHHHDRTGHSGRGITMNEIRASGYWIVKARSAVAAHIWKCVTCRRLRGPTVGQKMSDLPSTRLEPAPPFTYSGVDFFGPFYVKEGRSEKKRWGALFTCLSSRAVHIEVAHKLDTSSFLNAYRRFVSRRGPVRRLSCDRGTNFIGAKGELQAALNEMKNDVVRQELLKDGCDLVEFKFNVPHASHMGGIWERMIRSVRSILSGLLAQHGSQLDDELLHTLLVEVEAVVNSRPLTYHEVNHDSVEPLSPSQLLTLKSKVVQPLPGKFMKEDMYCRKRWRRVQFLANEFWSRWRKEYLPTLSVRRKWVTEQQNLKKGDVVLMLDENLPRCEWPCAIVMDTYPSEDSHVRKVKIKTAKSIFDRPIHKLITLFRPGDSPVEEP